MDHLRIAYTPGTYLGKDFDRDFLRVSVYLYAFPVNMSELISGWGVNKEQPLNTHMIHF